MPAGSRCSTGDDLVELGPTRSVFASARHRYTQRLLSQADDDVEESLKPFRPEDAPDTREPLSPGYLLRERCLFAVAACDERPALFGTETTAIPRVAPQRARDPAERQAYRCR